MGSYLHFNKAQLENKSGSCNHGATPSGPDLIRSVGYRQNVIRSSQIQHGATSAKSHYCLGFRSALLSPPPLHLSRGSENKRLMPIGVR